MRCSIVLLILLVASRVPAAEVPVIDAEARIPVGQTKALEFGTVPQLDTTVLLDVLSRLDSKGYGGSMYFLKLVLNGHVVGSAKSRTVSRLQNRPTVSPITADLSYSWFGSDAWRVLYAPDFEGASKQTYYVGNPYQLILDVTDLTNPAAENRLEISNMARPDTKRYAGTEAELVIKSLTIRTQPGASPTMLTPDATDKDVINRGTPGAGPAAYKGELLSGGGFAISTGGRKLEFASAISYPNAGLNLLTPTALPDQSGQKGWKVAVKPAKDGGEVTGAGSDYRVRRTVRFTPRRVEVSDEITNLHTDRKLGLLAQNEALLKGHAVSTRLAGNPDPGVNAYYSNGNPTVFLRLRGLGVGMVCEDDVFRNQATLFFDTDKNSAGLRTEMLCIPAGGSYTLQWSLYPVASEDYYDFINLVREDWGSNYTVEGAWTFFDPDAMIAIPVDDIRKQFRRLGIRYACYCGGWVDRKQDRKKIGFGTGVMDPYWADFRDRLRRAAARIREAVPECKVLVYYDSQRDTSDGGHERFKDSWMASANGDQLSTEWSGIYSLTWSVVATLHNSYGKAMLGVADRYMGEMKVDGLYWDEMETTGYGAPLIAHTIPDGHSCILDKKSYTIDHEIGITSLLGEGHRRAVIDRVRAKGGTLMGNGPTATRDILAKKPQRMVEIQHNDTWGYEGNLDTPLGYASSRMDFGNWIRSIRLATLLVGTRYTYEHEISPYVFPFTPIELHSGYLLGKERIITIHSGNYGWPGEDCLVQPRHFDKDGKLTTKDFVTSVTQESRTKVNLEEGEGVILEKLSVVLDANTGTAEVSKVECEMDNIALSVISPTGATLRIRSGKFPLKPGEAFIVQTGGASRTVLADRSGILTVPVKAAAPTAVSIRRAAAPR